MWEPRRLTTLWASTSCYRDSFTFFIELTSVSSCGKHWNVLTRQKTDLHHSSFVVARDVGGQTELFWLNGSVESVIRGKVDFKRRTSIVICCDTVPICAHSSRYNVSKSHQSQKSDDRYVFSVLTQHPEVIDIQSVPGKKINILGAHSIDYSKQNFIPTLSYSEPFPR
jgi:hypothetical protein